MRRRHALAPGGLLEEGTCDELGRIASWAGVAASGPDTLTISLRLQGLDAPSVVAERLPKALIHRNVPGDRRTYAALRPYLVDLLTATGMGLGAARALLPDD